MKTNLKNNEKLKKSCADAVSTLEKLNLEQFQDTLGRLKWCIGSYEFDKNPVGLNELGQVALKDLKAFKKENPRKVTKKVIEGLEKSLLTYQEQVSV
tara:strand:- start:299 stop:589 length:291 start_codon:yes stop_codon:yes gene_type:complete